MLNREYKNQCDDSDLCWATVSTQYSSAPPSTNQEGRVSQTEKRAEEEQGPKTRAPTLLPSGLREKLLVVDHHCVWIQLEPAVPAFETACCGHMIQFTQFNAWEEQASLDHALRKEHVCFPDSSPLPPDRTWWELGAVSDTDSNHVAKLPWQLWTTSLWNVLRQRHISILFI